MERLPLRQPMWYVSSTLWASAVSFGPSIPVYVQLFYADAFVPHLFALFFDSLLCALMQEIDGSNVPDNYVGTHILPTLDGEVTVNAGDPSYESCSQDFMGRFPLVFPPLPHMQGIRWMSHGQEAIVKLHGWACVAIISIAVIYFFFFSEFSTWLVSLFSKSTQNGGGMSSRLLPGTEKID